MTKWVCVCGHESRFWTGHTTHVANCPQFQTFQEPKKEEKHDSGTCDGGGNQAADSSV